METLVTGPWQEISVRNANLTPESRECLKHERAVDILGMAPLGGFPQARNFSLLQVQPFPLRYGKASRIGTANHHHRDADIVEARYVRNPRDAHRGQMRCQTREGFERGTSPIGAVRVWLRSFFRVWSLGGGTHGTQFDWAIFPHPTGIAEQGKLHSQA